MQVKTKIALFIIALFIVIVFGIFAGWKAASVGGGILGFLGAIFAGRSRNNDGRGNNSGIDGELEKTRSANNREGELNRGEGVLIEREGILIDREKQSLEDEKRDTSRDRALLEELQKRHPTR